ncbi:aspartate racemase [Pantoea vagans]|nr:aspartate racemase [Pantoea vagans]
MMVSIGVLAGMGPRSTAPFIDMLVTECQLGYGAKYDLDFPKMHIISLPTPFWPGRDIDDHAMVTALQEGIVDLVKARVSLIAVPCNLAHRYFAEMEKACGDIPLLHIAESALASLPAEASRIAVLATEPTLEAGFYQARIKASGREMIDSQRLREMATALIGQVKAKGFHDAEVQAGWKALVAEVERLEAEALLIACTDLSPLIKDHSYRFTIADTAATLSRATIQTFRLLSGYNPMPR